MIIVSGKLYVDPAAREQYLQGCVEIIEKARAAPGCLDFVLSADPIEAGRVNVYERWESDADLRRFRGAGPGPDQAAQIRDIQVETYHASPVVDV